MLINPFKTSSNILVRIFTNIANMRLLAQYVKFCKQAVMNPQNI